jgi:hypothetical protein
VNAKYRAWDSLKSVDYANGFSAARTFNSRLLLAHARIGTATTAKIEGDYNYHPDGRIRFADDQVDNKYDRAYSWDHVGRLAEAYSGGEARHFDNPAHPNNADGPYRQTYSYNFWGANTSRVNRFWSQNSTHTESYVATTGRNANTIWQYNASGNLTQDFSLEYRYDATGNSVYTGHIEQNQTGARYVFEIPDGDGRTARRLESANVGGLSAFTDTYYLRSSALGGKILTIIHNTGGKMRGLVYAGGSVIAEQISSQGVTWLHENPLTGSRGYSNQEGLYIKNGEPDAAGTDVGYEDPFLYPDPPSPDPDAGGLLPDILGGSGQNGEICKLDGFQFPCFFARNFNYTGAAQPLFTDPRKRDAFTDIHILGIIGHWEEEYRQLPSTWELVPVEEEGGGIWVEWQEILRFQTINTWRSSPLGFVHALRTGGIFRPSGGSTVLDREVRPRIETPYTTDMALDDIQTCLDTAGFVPGVGEPFDAASSVISLARGDYTSFGLGMAAMWPVGGQAATIAKLGRKSMKSSPIIIGENMRRVQQYADRVGGHAYSAWKLDPWDAATAMKRNERWIQGQIRQGREIIDIGPDFKRRAEKGIVSPFYEMERRNIRQQKGNCKKVFVRKGKTGGVAGLDF